MKLNLKKYADLDLMHNDLAKGICDLAKKSVKEKDFFTLVLSGGKTPIGLYKLLAKSPFINSFPWKKTYFFWGDERCVPPNSEKSNFATAYKSFLSKIPVDEKNIYRINGLLPPNKAAQVYESEITDFFLSKEITVGFDLILLGIGNDGHTASLFPHNKELNETKRLVVHTTAPRGITPKNRVTMTFKLINKSHYIYFVASGKNDIITKILDTESGKIYPATLVKPNTQPVWFVHE